MKVKHLLRVLGWLVLGLVLAGLSYVGYYRLDRHFARRAYEARISGQLPRIQRAPDGSVALRNPVVAQAADPWIVAVDSQTYLYVYSDHDRLIGKLSPNIYDWDEREPAWIWQSDTLVDYWAPEAHRVAGRWVIYFAANHGEPLVEGAHRTYVLEAVNNDPRRGFRMYGKLVLPTDELAIDATPLRYRDKDYLIYSGTEPGDWLHQKLFITELSDPFTPRGTPRLIARPTYDWELRGRRLGFWPTINEGPEVLQRDGRTFVVYSASGSWSDDYTLGLLELVGSDPLRPESWRKDPAPVLASANGVLAPGHAGLVRYAGQDFIAFHAAKHRKAAWDREMHLQPFTWREGKPYFGQPLGRDTVVYTDRMR